MKQKNHFIVAIIILAVILIVGCNQQKYDVDKKEVPQIEEKSSKFNISILHEGEVYKTIEVSDLTLPIDSEQEACDLFKQAHTSGYTCNFTEQPDYWSFDNEVICPPDLPYPCGGSCTGKINKINGNIEDLFCAIIA